MLFNERKAFTIIELLTSIAVFLIMAGMLLANYAGNRDSENLRSSAEQVVKTIRLAQSLALAYAPQKICSADGGVCGTAGNCCEAGLSCSPGFCLTAPLVPVSSYGVAVDYDGAGNKYVIYSNTGQSSCVNLYCAGLALANGIKTLPKGIIFDATTSQYNVPVGSAVNPLIFSSGDIGLTANSLAATTIVLRSQASGKIKTIIYRWITGTVSLQ